MTETQAVTVNSAQTPQKPAVQEHCEKCKKPSRICLCDLTEPVKARTRVLILQHPQEPDKVLGTAQFAHLMLPGSVLRIGLSWANLSKALGAQADPKRWIALYLGSAHPVRKADRDELTLVTKKGAPREEGLQSIKNLEGIVVLDGTWSQAKALWWRNAWLLKLHRAIANPAADSLYKNLRKEPRRECVSTLESIAIALSAIERRPEIGNEMRKRLETFLQRVKR